MRALLLATCLIASAACLEAPHTPEPRGCEADGGDTMSLPTPYFVDDHWYTAAQWNAMMRFISRQFMDTLLRLWFGDSDPASDSSGVVGGFVASDVSGTMKSQVTAGVAVLFNASVYTDTLDSEETASDLGFMWCPDTTQVTHSTADATNDRIDLIVVSSVLDSDYSATVGVKGGAPVSQDLRWGHVTTIEIVTGTPAGSPSAPATPAEKMALCEVLVPATETDAANFTYTDVREFVAGPYQRQDQELWYRTTDTTGVKDLLALIMEGSYANKLGIDLDEWWLNFYRYTNGASGEKEGNAAPLLMWNGDRTWTETKLWSGATFYLIEDTARANSFAEFVVARGMEASLGLKLDKNTAATANLNPFLTFDVPGRNLQLTEIEVQYEVVEAHAGGCTWEFRVWKWDASAGARVQLHSSALVATNSVATHTGTVTLTATVADLCMADGDAIEVSFYSAWDAVNQGHINLLRATAKWKEGRTP